METNQFKRELEDAVVNLPGVTSVEFFGSICEERFRPRRSDVDVFVHGSNLSGEVKRGIEDTFRQLVYKHELGVESAPFQHPVPTFIDSPARRVLYRAFKSGQISVDGLRQWIKQAAPSHATIWNIKDTMRRFEKDHPTLPPISQLLDKLI